MLSLYCCPYIRWLQFRCVLYRNEGCNIYFTLIVILHGWQIFVNYISDGLRKEYGHKGIIVQVGMATLMQMHCIIKYIFQNVEPLLVATSMSGIRRASFFIPSPTSAAKAAVATIGIQNSTNGCFPHALQVCLLL